MNYDTLDTKEKYGYSVEKFIDFFAQNKKIPKGSFQLKKRGDLYYWYFTLKIQSGCIWNKTQIKTFKLIA